MYVRHVLATEHTQLRELRLAALESDPEAFGSTYARELGRPDEFWPRWAEQSEEGSTQRTFVLVSEDGSWVGLSLVRLDDDNSGASILNGMWVAPPARGRGGAVALCEACAGWAAEHGCHEIALAVLTDNLAARRAYENAGFAVTGHSSWERDGGILDDLVMVRPL